MRILVEEPAGIGRVAEPVTLGVPFPKGLLFSPGLLELRAGGGERVPIQTQILARWSDASIKWMLLDFQACVAPFATAVYEVVPSAHAATDNDISEMVIEESSERLLVDTGAAAFVLDTRRFVPFRSVRVDGIEVVRGDASETALTDAGGRKYEARIAQIDVETRGPLRTTVRACGEFRGTTGPPFADFVGRISFFRGAGAAEIRLTIRNPRAARHRGGFWDLGDPGSVHLNEFAIALALASLDAARIEWLEAPSASTKREARAELEIYQDSSGGANWKSFNHANRNGVVMNVFRGYRVLADQALERGGIRASPVVTVRDTERSLTAAVEGFWENFPKAIEVSAGSLRIGLFPAQYRDTHELQAGEQKSHVILLHFGLGSVEPTVLRWAHHRLVPRATPEWYAETRAVPYVTPMLKQARASRPLTEADDLVKTAVTGAASFFARREVIDEYGWRHFGDLYADHEAIGHQGPGRLVAHYNNQYDVVWGAAVQYLRSGDPRWFVLMRDLARHVIDIDIYHTDRDRPAFNGGMFWHTEHYEDAATCTHRGYSRANVRGRSRWSCGGGPSSEHNYTSGLAIYYYLTGDPLGKETVRGLADWVLAMDDGRRRLGGWLDRRATGLASITANRDYHGPGRGCGNSINALLDAYAVTRDRRYIAKAEELLRRSIHPRDDIGRRRLDDVERRWSYTVFLQVIGKYLDIKAEAGEIDRMFAYARESLLHYARWMARHEVPYKVVMDRVEIPTETWSAQDIRKTNVFAFATKYASQREAPMFAERADYFFARCISDLQSFDTARLTRPIVILMTNAYIQGSSEWCSGVPDGEFGPADDFGEPQQFVPQFAELQRVRSRLVALGHRLRRVLTRK